ncbi:MAG: 5'-nucleotidase, lipoprotein e(P4) family [Flavobacteriaceae bacterium]|nr:5'-nucleotidase, lipoprotein e(P4) family [Flavobacteriaceae bacterium]
MRIILIFLSFLTFSCVSKISKKEHSLYWHSQSAEYKALCIQAYNIAKEKLDKGLVMEYGKPIAIVADLDETVLNNTPFNEMLLEKDLTYSQELWSIWVNKKIATAVPGSIEFFKYASKKNVEIIYLSNRLMENYQPTKENLIALGFPFNDSTKMLLRSDSRDKEPRRNELDDYEVIMLLGDNLGDFHQDFFGKDNQERWDATIKHKDDFGEKFILFPNLIYGNWEEGFEE